MTWTPSTPSLPPGSGRPTPTSARSTGSSPPPTPESSSATYTQTLRGDGLLGGVSVTNPGPARRSAGRVTWPGNAEDPEVLSCPHGRFPPGDVELVLDPADPGASGIAGDGQDRRDLGRRLPVSEARKHLDVAAVECRRRVRTSGTPGGRPVHGFLPAATE